MKWIGITGSSQNVDERVERDVRAAVRDIFERGDGIVAGGAVGVDYIATDEMMRLDPTGARVRVIIPNSFEGYLSHFKNNWLEYAGSQERAKQLIEQLTSIAKVDAGSVVAMGLSEKQDAAVFLSLRNAEVVRVADEMLAFQVNKSSGTQDTIDKARAKGIPVRVNSYHL